MKECRSQRRSCVSSMTQLIDSLVHTGLNPVWPSAQECDISLESILTRIENEDRLSGALVQTSPWYDSGFSMDLFISILSEYKGDKMIVPVFTLPFCQSLDSAVRIIESALQSGFRVFKIHPRYSEFSEDISLAVLNELCKRKLFTQLCTYQYSYGGSLTFQSTVAYASKAAEIAEKNQSYVCLMHGFGTDIIKAHNVVRHAKFTILDMSMTILKYEGSSVDNDIRYLCSKFDERICIGSDFPEWNYQNLFRRIDFFLEGLSREKCDNIMSNNLVKVLSHGSMAAI